MGVISINCDAQVNQPPNSTGWLRVYVNYNATHVFTLANFTTETTPPYADPEGDDLAGIKITELPTMGQLLLSSVAVQVDDEIGQADIAAGNLTYLADGDNEGYSDGNARFTVKDQGSNTYTTISSQAITFIVKGDVNRAPSNVGEGEYDITVGQTVVFTRNMLTTQLEAPYSDPEGDIAENLLVVSTPTYGELKLNGILVGANQVIPFTDIDSGLLTYSATTFPEGNIEGFEFKISDAGSGQYTG